MKNGESASKGSETTGTYESGERGSDNLRRGQTRIDNARKFS